MWHQTTLISTNMDAEFYWAVLGSAGVIKWLQDGVYEALRDITWAKGVQLEASNDSTYLHPDPSTMPEIWLDSAMRLSSLDVSHADLPNETWPHGGTEQSWQYLANLICHFPSFCLLDATGHPVSWSPMDPFGAMAHGYTLPQHRRHCYMRVLSTMTAKWMHA
ncbi:unnamed protein product [Natator depressus]